MASASEVFRVIGKIVLEGQADVEKGLDSVSKKASNVDTDMGKALGGLGKNIPKNVTKPLDDSIDGTSRKMGDFEKNSGGFTDLLKSGFGIGIGMKAFDLAGGVVDKFGGFVKNAVFGMNSTLQDSQLQFTTLMGNADDAQKQVAFLFDFAKKTPFETGPVIQASKMLQTFGGAALNTSQNLTLIGDAAAATGAPIDELGTWTGRLYASLQAGQPFGEAAQRLTELAVLTPQARLEMEKMQKEGKSAAEIFTYFQGTLGNFTGAMDKQAGTWTGLTSTFTDTVNILSAKAMKPFFDLASKGLATLNDTLGSDEFAKGAERVANTVAGAVGGVVDRVTSLIDTLAPKVVTGFKIAKDGIQTFTEALAGNWTDAPGIGRVADVIGKIGLVIRNDVMPAVSTFTDFITNGFNTILPAVRSVASGITDNFNPAMLLTPLIGPFSMLFGNISSIATQVKVAFLDVILPAIQTFATQIQANVGTAFTFVTSTVLPAIQSLRTTVADTFSNVILPAIIGFVSTVLPALASFGAWFSGQVMQAVIRFGTDLIGVFTTQALPAILGFVATVMPLLQNFAQWFVAVALPQIQIFAQGLIQAWDEIEPKIISALTNIVNIVTTVLGVLIPLIKAHGDQIVAYLTLAWDTVSSTIGGVLEIVKNVIKLALDIISGNWSGAWQDVQGIFQGVWDTITGILTPAITIIQAIVSAFTTAIGGFFSDLGTKTNTIWNNIQTSITTVTSAISGVITGFLSAINAVWQPAWSVIQTVIDTVWRAIETIFNVETAAITAIINAFLPPIKAFIETTMNAISSTWDTIWHAIQNTVQTVWDFINGNIITPILSAINTFINTQLNTIQTIWNTTWNAISTTAQTVWNAIQNTVTTIWNAISSTLTTGWNTLQSTAQTTWNAIQSFIETPLNAAKATLDTIWDNIQSKATGTWTAIKNAISTAGGDIKAALMKPFEDMRDAVEGVMKSAGNKMLSPLQGAIDGFKDFVDGVRGAINSISGKLGLGDVIRDTWSGARIRQLANGTKNWMGGVALIGEKGTEAARLPDGTIRMFSSPQFADLPAGTEVWNARDTRNFVTNSPNAPVKAGLSNGASFYAAQLLANPTLGKGGLFGGISKIGDTIGGLAGDALGYARDLASKGAEKVIGTLIDALGVPKLPGDMSGFGGAGAKMVKDSAIKGIAELIDIVKKNLPAEQSSGSSGGPVGPAGSINGVDGGYILDIARKTSGVRNWCEKFVGDVFARAGARYARATDAFEHSNMQGTTPGTGPTGAPVYTGFGHPGDVAISMGNGMVYGTEGNGPLGAGPFSPYAGARFTTNPAANGMVVTRPTNILAGETMRAQPEIVTPEELMRKTFANELQRAGAGGFGGGQIIINVTANTEAEGYAAGRSAATGFRDRMSQAGFNRIG